MTYTGNMLPELYARVDNAIELSRRTRATENFGRPSSVNSGSGWKIIVAIQGHLCDRVMTKADVQAWHLLTDIQEDLLWGQPETECQAAIQDGHDLCGHDVVLGTEFCERHQP